MRSSRAFAVAVVVAVATTACGTRVPNSSFAGFPVSSGYEGGGTTAAGPANPGGAGRAEAPSGGTAGESATAGTSDLDGLGDLGGAGGGGDGTTSTTAGPTGSAAVGADRTADTSGGDGGTTTQAGARSDPGTGGDAAGTSGGSTDGDGGGTGDGGGGGGGTPVDRNSDVGVTDTTIRVGNIVSKSGALGPDQFTPSYYGANAYFAVLNAQGGVNGRTVEFSTCDDAEDSSRDLECAQNLVEGTEVFAFVANNTRKYAAASYVNDHGVPDIGGQPIGNEYYTYPWLYTFLGSEYKRDGQTGNDGELYYSTGSFDYFVSQVGITKAAVLYYSIPISKQQGKNIVSILQLMGVDTIEFEVNPAFPQYENYVSTMQQQGVDAIFDTMDVNANRNLCQRMESKGLTVKVKATTVAGWTRAVGTDFPATCRQSMYVTGDSTPMSKTSVPEVKLFNQAMHQVYQGAFDQKMHQWAFEGWLGAKQFVEGVRRMGDDVTRAGLKQWMDAQTAYTYGGVTTPEWWHYTDFENDAPKTQCWVVAKWDDAADDFVEVAGIDHCPAVQWISYAPVG